MSRQPFAIQSTFLTWCTQYMRVGWPIIGLVALIGAAGFWLLSDIARDQDEAYQHATRNYVARSIDDFAQATHTLTAEYSVWDDAVINLTFEDNDGWIGTNFNALSMSAVGVFRASKGVRYLYLPPEHENLRTAILQAMPMLSKDPALAFDPLRSAPKPMKLGRNLVIVGGQLAAVSVQLLQPESGSPILAKYATAERDYVVAIRVARPETISNIGSDFALREAKISIGPQSAATSSARVYHYIRNDTGKMLANINWQDRRPGSSAFHKRIIPIAFGLFLFGLLTIVITHKIVTARLTLLAKARAAEDASKAKSNFIAKVSHELRTPLNTIIGYSEMIEDESSGAGQSQTAQDAKKVTSSAQHLLALINDLLDHSKLEAGKMDLNSTQTDIGAVLAGVGETVRDQIKKNNNQLVLECDPEIGTGLVDAMRLKQCLHNLLSNAGKFTTGGTITLSATAVQVRGADSISFCVADTGAGMKEETASRLFAPFFQVSGSSSTKFDGAGLGLALTKALVVAMGGTISVESALGEGSRFTIVLPRNFQATEPMALAA